jgi:hypothetical protein
VLIRVKDTLLRLSLAVVFGVYFGTVVCVSLMRSRRIPESVQMLANRRGSGLETEVRVNGVPVYLAGVEGV